MNIAHLLPYSAAFPLTRHHGRYDWALRLAVAQAAAGHHVTIYAAPGSHGSPGIDWRSAPYDFGDKTLNNAALIRQALRAPEHTVFHSHFDMLHYFLADAARRPIIATQHWFPNEAIAHAARLADSPTILAVPPTAYMYAENKRLGIASAGVIHHGIDLAVFTPRRSPRGDRLLFVGRVAPHKGVREAIELARDAGVPLDIVGKVMPKDETYWQSLQPLIDGRHIRYLGSQPPAEVSKLMAAARAFLFLPQGVEAFAQTLVEAQACGTPVITNDRGAASELVLHGVTGFVAHNRHELLTAIRHIDTIDPRACRQHAEQFNVTDMIQAYEALYRRLAEQ